MLPRSARYSSSEAIRSRLRSFSLFIRLFFSLLLNFGATSMISSSSAMFSVKRKNASSRLTVTNETVLTLPSSITGFPCVRTGSWSLFALYSIMLLRLISLNSMSPKNAFSILYDSFSRSTPPACFSGPLSSQSIRPPIQKKCNPFSRILSRHQVLAIAFDIVRQQQRQRFLGCFEIAAQWKNPALSLQLASKNTVILRAPLTRRCLITALVQMRHSLHSFDLGHLFLLCFFVFFPLFISASCCRALIYSPLGWCAPVSQSATVTRLALSPRQTVLG